MDSSFAVLSKQRTFKQLGDHQIELKDNKVSQLESLPGDRINRLSAR